MRIIKILLIIVLPLSVFAQRDYLASSPEKFKFSFNVNAANESKVRCQDVILKQANHTFQIPMDGEFSVLGSFEGDTRQVTDITLIIVPNNSTVPYNMIVEMGYVLSNILDITSQFQMDEEMKMVLIDKLGILRRDPSNGQYREAEFGNCKYWYEVSTTTGIWFGVEVLK